MAKFNLENYLDKDGLGFPLNFRRGNPNPLDNSSVWKSLTEAQNYAQTDPTAYVGQILSVVNYTPAVTDEEGTVTTPSQSTVEVYYIKDEAGALEQVGTSPVGDENTITVAEDGTVSLYGVEGLALTRTEEDGSTTNINYQPLLVNGKLTWVEPSATTVEGLATEIEGLKTRISAVETTVGKAAEGDKEATGLVKAVADLDGRLTTAEGEIDDLQAKDTELEGAVADVEALIGEVTEGKTVVEMIEAAQEAATYDDTELAGRVTTAEGEIDDLQAKDTEIEGNITAINDKIGEVTEGKTVVEMISDAQTAATYDDTGVKADIKANADAIDAIEADYLKGADKTELEGKIKANADAIELLTNGVSAEEVDGVNDLINYVKEHGTEVTGINSNISKNAEAIEDVKGRVDTLEGEMDTAQADIETLKTGVSDNETAINGVKELVGETSVDSQIKAAITEANLGQYALATDLTGVDNRVKAIEEDYLKAADKTELADLISANTTKLGTIETDYKAADNAINATLAEKAAQADLNSAVERIAALEGVGSEKNVIASVDTTQFNVDANRNLTLLDVAMSKVTGLSDALAGKVDKVDGSRLITSDEADKLEKLVLGENGEVSVSGTIAAGNVDGLADWITARAGTLKGLSENNLTDALLEKLNGIEAGAQVNDIEVVTLNGTALTISNKTVNIPLATAELAGIVKSSADENKVAVGTDGTMEVNSVNVNKLVQTAGESLILNGGTATV